MGFDKQQPNERAWVGKVVVRSIQLLISGACIGASAYTSYYNAPLLVGVIITFIWNLANIIVRFSCANPIHPGANVAVELILWQAIAILAGFVSVRILAGVATATADYVAQNACRGSSSCTYTTTSVKLDAYGTAALVALGTGCFVALFHFILFVWACVDTHRWRRARREAMYTQQMKVQSTYQSSFQQAPYQQPSFSSA